MFRIARNLSIYKRSGSMNRDDAKLCLSFRHRETEPGMTTEEAMTNRKRARKQPRQETETETNEASAPEKPLVTDALIASTVAHIENVVVPRLFADIARRLGSRDVRPADFRCFCAPSHLDGLPVCEGKKPNCRFADRAGDQMRAMHLADKDKARYDAVFDAAMEAHSRLNRHSPRTEHVTSDRSRGQKSL